MNEGENYMKNVCQVCGKPIKEGQLNCNEHLYVRERMMGLALDIYKLDSYINTDKIHELAKIHKCCIATVYNHLKRQGYRSMRGWKATKKKRGNNNEIQN